MSRAASSSNRTRNSVRNLMSGFGVQLLLVILRFITRTVFINTLGPSYLGINGLFSDILSMLSITELGMDTAINFRLYKSLADNNDEQIRLLLKFYKLAYRIIGCVIIAIGLLLIPALPALISDYDSLEGLGINAVFIFILYLIQSASSYLFFAYRSAIIKADQKTYITDIVNMIVSVVSNLVQIAVLVLLEDFILYTIVLIVFTIVQNIINAIVAKRIYPQYFTKDKNNLPRSEVREMLKDCGATFVYKVNGTVLRSTDSIVLSAFLGLVTVGLYSNYLLIYNTIKSFLNRILEAFKASIGNLYAAEDISKSYFIFRVMNFITFILYGTACVGIAVVANEFILVWIGDDYLIAQPFSILLGVETLFAGIKINLGQMRDVSGAFRQMWFRPIIGIIINLGVSIALVQVWGVWGVLVGTISADVLTNFLIDPSIIYRHSFHAYRPVSAYYKNVLPYIFIIFIIGAIDFLICDNLLVGLGIGSLIFHIVICLVTVPLAFFLIYWRTDECKYIIGKVKYLISCRH